MSDLVFERASSEEKFHKLLYSLGKGKFDKLLDKELDKLHVFGKWPAPLRETFDEI